MMEWRRDGTAVVAEEWNRFPGANVLAGFHSRYGPSFIRWIHSQAKVIPTTGHRHRFPPAHGIHEKPVLCLGDAALAHQAKPHKY